MKSPLVTRQFTVKSIEDLDEVAREVIAIGNRVLLLQGELGAGKTTFVKALCRTLGSLDEVTSPTFTLVNEYRDISGAAIFHLDLYRLESIEDVLHIGFEDYLNSGAWCFIEWPEIIETMLTKEGITRLYLEVTPDESRRILILK